MESKDSSYEFLFFGTLCIWAELAQMRGFTLKSRRDGYIVGLLLCLKIALTLIVYHMKTNTLL